MGEARRTMAFFWRAMTLLGGLAHRYALSGRSKTKQNDGLKCCKGLFSIVQSLNCLVFALNPRIV